MQTYVKVFIMAEPGRHLAQPTAIAARGVAEMPFDPFIDEYPVGRRLLSGGAQHRSMTFLPDREVDSGVALQHQRTDGEVLTCIGGEARSYTDLEPDIDVETGLVAGMKRIGRTAARLADIADIDMGQAKPAVALGQIDREANGEGMAPVTVATEANRFVTVAFVGQSYGADHAAGRVGADGLRLPGGRG